MISVCMATYNGQKYISKQLESIIKNLSNNDEIIISDDGSKDETLEIIQDYRKNFKNIKVYEGPHKGVKANFENALRHASGEYIYLTDQDDIWMDNKVEMTQRFFKDSNVTLVIHDAAVIDNNMDIVIGSFFSTRNSKSGIIKNIVKNSYIGCCMAFRKEILDYILPIPDNIHMHDQWIGIISEVVGKSVFIPEKLIYYRRHGENVSTMQHLPLRKMIRNRLVFVINLLKWDVRIKHG